MIKAESDLIIIKNILFKYIIRDPINRRFVFPVFVILVIAKYLEVLVSTYIEQISDMVEKKSYGVLPVALYAIVSIFAIILSEMQSFLICRAGQLGNRLANRDTYKYFLNLEPEEFNSIGKGEVINTISRKSQAAQDVIDVITLNLFPTFLTIAFVSDKVFKSLGIRSVVVINFCVLIYSIATVKITTWRNKMRKNLINSQNNSNNILVDGLYNFETIFTYDSEDIEVDRYDFALKKVERHSTDISKSLYLLNLAQRSIWWIMSISLIVLSIFFSNEQITSKKFAFIICITGIIIKSLDNFGFMYGKLQTAIINARLTNFEARKKKHDGYRTKMTLESQMAVKDLSILYNDKYILQNANFAIRKGEKVAIIGRNGTGKSTLLKCLVKLLKSNGIVEFDEISSEILTDASFKRLISYIPQNVVLFDDTVIGNLKYGNLKIFDEDVYKLGNEFGIHKSIMTLDNGYLTRVGEQGKNISGGERQKIAILRAILNDPQILLMDESTSNLDKHSELAIFSKLMANPTLTLIAIVHNLDLLSMFDKILWVDSGSITEVENLDLIDLKSWNIKDTLKSQAK